MRRTNTIRAPTSSSSIAPAWSREAELPSASLFGGEAYRVRGQRRARPLRGRQPTGHHVGDARSKPGKHDTSRVRDQQHTGCAYCTRFDNPMFTATGFADVGTRSLSESRCQRIHVLVLARAQTIMSVQSCVS